MTVASEWSSVPRGVGALPRITSNGMGRVHALGDVNGLSREAIEALPAAIYMTDAEGRLTFYNEAAAELWGCRPELGESKFCGSWKLYWPDGTPLPHDECPMAIGTASKATDPGYGSGSRAPRRHADSLHPLSDATFRRFRTIDRRRQHACRYQRTQAERGCLERSAMHNSISLSRIARLAASSYDYATKNSAAVTRLCSHLWTARGHARDFAEDWRARVHPDDLPRMDAVVRRALH